MQRALIQYRNPKNYDLVYEALVKAERTDLIGFDKKCLIKPRRFSSDKAVSGGKQMSYKVASGKQGTKSAPGKKNEAPKKKKTIRQVHKKK